MQRPDLALSLDQRRGIRRHGKLSRTPAMHGFPLNAGPGGELGFADAEFAEGSD